MALRAISLHEACEHAQAFIVYASSPYLHFQAK